MRAAGAAVRDALAAQDPPRPTELRSQPQEPSDLPVAMYFQARLPGT